MGAQLLEGTPVAARILAEVKVEVSRLKAKGVYPSLAVVLVGDDPASISYVAGKQKTSESLGILSETHRLGASSSLGEILWEVAGLNERPDVHGILVQSPLPEGIDEPRISEAIDPSRDVDGIHPLNVGRMLAGRDCPLPCTPAGIVELLSRTGHDPAGKHVVIVGRSNIVGRPLANLLSRKGRGGDATVTLCHSRTPYLRSFTLQADILVVAIGNPRSITSDMVREGAVVVDVGVNRVPDPTAKKGYRLVGDVDFEGVSAKASAITPVPGGVGPMTVAMLMRNVVRAASLRVQ
jgi:methylenetetrahydrofolate dehydrogenase (NADP+)/methenyltetrahydrofolate cyclohydrolase